METYQILQIGFYICLAVAVLFFIVTLLLFFLFDIRTIFAARTGKQKAKSIKELQEANTSTGRLMRRKPSSRKTGSPENKKPVIKKGVVLSPGEIDGSAATAKIKKGKTAEIKAKNATSADGSGETALLDDGSEETAILGAERVMTSVLDSPTVRLDSADTTVLVESASIPDVEGVRFDIVKKAVLVHTEEIV